MSQAPRSAVVTLAMGRATENLDYTFSSFAQCPGVELHAFIVGNQLPKRRIDGIQYHLLPSVPDFSHPLREIYFRRMEVLDSLGVDYALTVDCFDVLCLQPLPPFEQMLGNADVAACVEHQGSRYLMGLGYTPNFLNGGVFLWNVPRSRDIRSEILARGRSYFRTIADDQHCINEVIHARHHERLRILPGHYNYRAYLNKKHKGWPTVSTLDGVRIYHCSACIDEAKAKGPFKPTPALPELPKDGGPLDERQQFWRRLRNRFKPWVIK